jgi:hypothetical protein
MAKLSSRKVYLSNKTYGAHLDYHDIIASAIRKQTGSDILPKSGHVPYGDNTSDGDDELCKKTYNIKIP